MGKGSTTAKAASDHTVKADVRGLRQATDYYFRFTAGNATSPVGRTRTTPAHDAAAPGVRFGVVSCANWESGYFAAYRHLAARADLDAILHLGDYIYEYATGYPAEKDVSTAAASVQTSFSAGYRRRTRRCSRRDGGSRRGPRG